MKEELNLAEMDSVETVIDGMTHQCSKPDEHGKIKVFAEDVWFLVRYINTLRADALLASEKAVSDAINAANDFEDLRARLAQLESVLAEAGEALEPFAAMQAAFTKAELDDAAIIQFCSVEFMPGENGDEWKCHADIKPIHYRRAATVSAKIDAMDAALKEDGK